MVQFGGFVTISLSPVPLQTFSLFFSIKFVYNSIKYDQTPPLKLDHSREWEIMVYLRDGLICRIFIYKFRSFALYLKSSLKIQKFFSKLLTVTTIIIIVSQHLGGLISEKLLISK